MLSFVEHAPQSSMDLCITQSSKPNFASGYSARCAHVSCNADLYAQGRNLTEVCTDGFVGHLKGS